MKIFLGLVVMVIFSFAPCIAQDTTYVFINYEKEVVFKDQAKFTRKIFKDGDLWGVNDYYLSGELQMTGAYTTRGLRKKQGLFLGYHKNGVISSEYNYHKGKIQGEAYLWHKNGAKQSVNRYNEAGKKHGLSESWRDDKVYYGGGQFDNGEKIGEWKWYWPNGQASLQEMYNEEGELQYANCWEADGTVSSGDCISDRMPEFIGGPRALSKFLRSTIRYPKTCMKYNIRGKVYLKFVVKKNGEVGNIIVLKSVHPLIDDEAVRVMNLLPKWKPGLQYNQPVNVWYVLPINFRLN